jgi:PAP2 superfamily
MLVHKTIIRFVIFSLLCLAQNGSFAQVADSAAQNIADTGAVNFKGTTCSKSLPNNKFKKEIKKYILPTVLFTYGLVTPSIKGLKKLDESVKQNTLQINNRKVFKLDDYAQYSPIAAVYGLNLAGYKGKNNLKNATMILITSKIISTAGAQGIKRISKRLRPDSSANNSFPSGHTTEAFANATFLFEEYKDKNIWIGIAGYAIASTTAYLRIYNNRHWLSDVVAGAGLGIASTKFAYWLYPKISKKLFKKNANNTVIMPSYSNRNFAINYVRRF